MIKVRIFPRVITDKCNRDGILEMRSSLNGQEQHHNGKYQQNCVCMSSATFDFARCIKSVCKKSGDSSTRCLITHVILFFLCIANELHSFGQKEKDN